MTNVINLSSRIHDLHGIINEEKTQKWSFYVPTEVNPIVLYAVMQESTGAHGHKRVSIVERWKLIVIWSRLII